MKKFYCNTAIILILMLAMSSCEIEFGNHTNGYLENSDYLCSRPWVDEWYDDDGNYCYQELNFYPDQRGTEYSFRENRYGNREESYYNFVWDWWDSFYTSLRLNYGGSYSYMDNISMGGNTLNCLFNGEPAYFVGK